MDVQDDSNADRRIDEAFSWLSENVVAYTDLVGEVRDDEAGVRMAIEALTIDTPVELDVCVRADGSVELGCAPPIYPVDLTVEPVLHRLEFRAVVEPQPGATEYEAANT